MWALVQVALEDTDEDSARRSGVYRCRWYAPHPEDEKYRSARESRFWPVVRRLDKQGFFRERHIVSPDKVHGLLERNTDLGWYQLHL